MTPAVESALRSAFRNRTGCATALDLSTGKPLAHWRPDLVKSWSAAPGSVLKPLVAAILHRPEALVPCRQSLSIDGVNCACTHAPQTAPLDLPTALALSCNHWFAAQAATLDPARLARALAGAEFTPPATTEDIQLLALGARHIRVTPAWLARAFHRLLASPPEPVLDGLRRAVSQGTAVAAKPALGGKTGTSREASWFAGFNQKLLLVVALPGGTGGGDAAPIAGEIFAQCAR